MLSDAEKRARYDKFGDDEGEEDMDIDAFMQMFGAMFGEAMFGEFDDDDMEDFMFMGKPTLLLCGIGLMFEV